MSASNNRIDRLFAGRQPEQPALVCFTTAGDPGLDVTVPVMHALVRGGADMLELGMPFSDPMADGPVIQAAGERALAAGADMDYVFGCVAQFRDNDSQTPVILMGYLNPLERYGFETFCQKAAGCGVDGLIIVDLPPEEYSCIEPFAGPRDIRQIFMVAPTTSESRMQAISEVAGGFIYYVSLKGITGAANLDARAVAERLTAIRNRSDLPVAVGFGIKSRPDVEALAGVADAVVVGTALVDAMHKAGPEQAPAVAESFAAGLCGNAVTNIEEPA